MDSAHVIAPQPLLMTPLERSRLSQVAANEQEFQRLLHSPASALSTPLDTSVQTQHMETPNTAELSSFMTATHHSRLLPVTCTPTSRLHADVEPINITPLPASKQQGSATKRSRIHALESDGSAMTNLLLSSASLASLPAQQELSIAASELGLPVSKTLSRNEDFSVAAPKNLLVKREIIRSDVDPDNILSSKRVRNSIS